MGHKRIDVLLVERGLFESRAKAQAAITAGGVRVDGALIAKPSDTVCESARITAEAAHPWVGRGALKLAHALAHWPISPEGQVVLDIGASTGGFTQVCLSKGAARVYAIDVGRGQLHAEVRADPRVINLEGLDARRLDVVIVPEPVDLIVCDASFIGLAKALPAALALARAGADLIALIKPQFEVGPGKVGKGGVVRAEAHRQTARDGVKAFLEGAGWRVEGLIDSPIEGGDGNREYLIHARKPT